MINNFNSKKDKQFEVRWVSIIYVTKASINFLIKNICVKLHHQYFQ